MLLIMFKCVCIRRYVGILEKKSKVSEEENEWFD